MVFFKWNKRLTSKDNFLREKDRFFRPHFYCSCYQEPIFLSIVCVYCFKQKFLSVTSNDVLSAHPDAEERYKRFGTAGDHFFFLFFFTVKQKECKKQNRLGKRGHNSKHEGNKHTTIQPLLYARQETTWNWEKRKFTLST